MLSMLEEVMARGPRALSGQRKSFEAQVVHAEHRGIYLGLPDQATGGVHEYGFCSYAPQGDCMIPELALCSSTMLVKFAKGIQFRSCLGAW